MIAVKLKGGLGNQMFQYAFGRSLAIYYQTNLLLDISELQNKNIQHAYRNYALNVFQIKASIAQQKLQVEKENKTSFLRFFDLRKSKKSFKLITERKYHFDTEIGKAFDNCYLDGYWQSPLYFNDIENEIRADFKLSIPLSPIAEPFLNRINSCNAVSIHIRRGDYVTNAETNSYHGICDLEYYKAAVEIIKSKISNPVFFIFTDDIDWVNVNFIIDATFILVSQKELTQFDDLQLMCACKHAIIANSSFSWWAAWLIVNAKKIVIAPSQWFQNSSVNTDNLFPKSWLRI